jgi:uncharacterized protein (DUF433 family)/DNA-binding transcriptional MerR regulator
MSTNMISIPRTAKDRWLRRLYLPTYPVGEAAKLVGVHRGTVTAWHYGYVLRGGRRTETVLGERQRGQALSYLQLVEVAFVATLRELGVTLRKIRIARDYLATRFQKEYPFAQLELETDGVEVLKELEKAEGAWVRTMLVPSRYGQFVWAEAIEDRIREFDYDEMRRLAIRWFPRGREVPVVIDPQIAFGAPILADSKLPTWVVRDRVAAGESPIEIEEDFGISEIAVRQALAFEGVEYAAASA